MCGDAQTKKNRLRNTAVKWRLAVFLASGGFRTKIERIQLLRPGVETRIADAGGLPSFYAPAIETAPPAS